MTISQSVLLDYGSGGRASHRLIQELFFKYFSNPILDVMDDAARLEIRGPIAMSTDSYTVTPLFFPGGSIGTLAVHGTVNDVAMLGAEPLYMSCAFIIEEGLPLPDLEKVVQDMARAAREANVLIVTGDTKVVPKGACDKLFINTTGIGVLLATPGPSGHNAEVGDAVLVSGSMGNHGLTVMMQRENLHFDSDVCSDSAPLNGLTTRLILEVGDIHVLRDPTRGGLATTLNEIAEQSKVVIHVREVDIPVDESVKSGCSFLGLDPLYLANEGKCICILPPHKAEAALALLRSTPYGAQAAIIGSVQAPGSGPARAGQVVLETPLGGKRLLAMLEGAQLPRIC